MARSQTLLDKVLRLPLSLIPRNTEVRILRGPMRGQKWVVGAASHACWTGSYEVDALRAFADAILPGAVVYDVGANVGVYSLLASSRVGAAGRVYAFEPMERNLGYLHRHLRLNRTQNCFVLEAAVSDTDGTRRFSTADWDYSMGRLAQEGEIVVASITLDSCVYGEKRLPPPNLIKIDVEGAEMEVLAGASRMLAEFHPRVFLEVHGTELHADCRAFLLERGYCVKEGYGRLIGTWSRPG